MVKGAGVDCGMLLISVFTNLGLIEGFTPDPYALDWYMHSVEELYLNTVLANLIETNKPDLGDVAMFKVGRCYSHGGIISKLEPLTIIHAFQPVGFVIEEAIKHNSMLISKLKSAKYASAIRENL